MLIRNSLLASQRLTVSGPAVLGPAGPCAGRLLMVPITWGHQRINVVGVYMHASSYQHNVAMIQGTLQQWAAATPRESLVVMGDFNSRVGSAQPGQQLPARVGQFGEQTPPDAAGPVRGRHRKHGCCW